MPEKRSPVFGRKTSQYFKKFWTLQNRKSAVLVLVNYSVFIWQGVNETKKVKNPCANRNTILQSWSPRGRPWPRGRILKSFALASKVKSSKIALSSARGQH